MIYPLTLNTKDVVEKTEKAVIVNFGGVRKVFNTSISNGGVRYDLESVFNYDLKDKNGICELHENTYEKELISIAKGLGLNYQKTAGMTTAVSMDDMVIKNISRHGLSVYAIVTAGIENNGGSAGDPCSYYEDNSIFKDLCGTINIIVIINADLPDGILCRAAVTATEAKTTAIRELRLPSLYSEEIATGSGTDGLFIITDTESLLKRTDAGQHSLLGEMVGKAVKQGVKDALLRHMSVYDTDMTKMSNRLKRFGINLEGFKIFSHKYQMLEVEAEEIWEKAQNDFSIAINASMVAALIDDVHHDLIQQKDALKVLAEKIIVVDDLKPLNFNDLWYEYLYQSQN